MGQAKITFEENDAHFADLAKRLKHDHNDFTFKKVRDWYCEHYLMVNDEMAHRYAPAIAWLLVGYMDRQGIMGMKEFHDELAKYDTWQNPYQRRFDDLAEDRNETYTYRVIAVCCVKLIWTDVNKIPGFVRDAKE